jgi:hypothetical protein
MLHLQNENASPQPQPQPPQVIDQQAWPTASASTGDSDLSYAEEVTAALTTPVESGAMAAVDLPVAVSTQAAEVKAPEFVDTRNDRSTHDSRDVSFVRDARRQAFWRKPLTRVMLGLSALLLLSLLALQVAVTQRDRLAALEPGLKPILQLLCERLACQVGPVRQIEAIVMDSSSFNKINDAGIYQLSFSFKNAGSAAVAMPSLEVTLTDTQDQPVLRRVLFPAQFSSNNNSMLAAGAEFSAVLNLQVTAYSSPAETATAPGTLLRVAGYRLLAFYP